MDLEKRLIKHKEGDKKHMLTETMEIYTYLKELGDSNCETMQKMYSLQENYMSKYGLSLGEMYHNLGLASRRLEGARYKNDLNK